MEAEIKRGDLISDYYLDLNLQMHMDRPSYGASGKRWAKIIEKFASKDILDYGCGKGTLKEALGWPIHEYDPAIPGKNLWPEPADIIVCTDVLEHLEPEKLDTILMHMRYLMKVCGFFVVSTRPAGKKLKDGRNAHLIAEPIEWWAKKLTKYFKIDRLVRSDKGDEFVVIVS